MTPGRPPRRTMSPERADSTASRSMRDDPATHAESPVPGPRSPGSPRVAGSRSPVQRFESPPHALYPPVQRAPADATTTRRLN